MIGAQYKIKVMAQAHKIRQKEIRGLSVVTCFDIPQMIGIIYYMVSIYGISIYGINIYAGQHCDQTQHSVKTWTSYCVE